MSLGSSASRRAILVFGAAVDRCGRPREPLVRRLRQALREALADPGAVVVVSGGIVSGRPPEAPAMRDWLVAEGLDPGRIILEPEATSTYENARYCADLIAARGFQRVTLVTARYHMARSRWLFARALAARNLRIESGASAAPDEPGILRFFARQAGELWKLAQEIVREPP